ncbi:MAG: hypothetical protein AVDCRST_MAG06-2842, partial [uncultured Nocardioides sp.]
GPSRAALPPPTTAPGPPRADRPDRSTGPHARAGARPRLPTYVPRPLRASPRQGRPRRAAHRGGTSGLSRRPDHRLGGTEVAGRELVPRSDCRGRPTPGARHRRQDRAPQGERRADEGELAPTGSPRRGRRSAHHDGSAVRALRDALRHLAGRRRHRPRHGGVRRPGDRGGGPRLHRIRRTPHRRRAGQTGMRPGERELVVADGDVAAARVGPRRRVPTAAVQPARLRPLRPAHRDSGPARPRGRGGRRVRRSGPPRRASAPTRPRPRGGVPLARARARRGHGGRRPFRGHRPTSARGAPTGAVGAGGDPGLDHHRPAVVDLDDVGRVAPGALRRRSRQAADLPPRRV